MSTSNFFGRESPFLQGPPLLQEAEAVPAFETPRIETPFLSGISPQVESDVVFPDVYGAGLETSWEPETEPEPELEPETELEETWETEAEPLAEEEVYAEELDEPEVEEEDLAPRAVPRWLEPKTRVRVLREIESEAFDEETFQPTAKLGDFGPQMRKAWHNTIEAAFAMNVAGAAHRIALGLSITDAEAQKHVRFFSTSSRPPKVALTATHVPWRALPTSSGSAASFGYDKLDDRVNQDEYCEWAVFRNGAGKIVRIVFTSEPPEYYQFMYDPGVPALKAFARKLLVKVYQERCGTKSVKLADLETSTGEYDPMNAWNNQHCVHLQQENNTLGAQINIAARAAIVRTNSAGIITTIDDLMVCDSFGERSRQSDPHIGDAVNKLARANRFVTLENPVGLYMTHLDTKGWKTPDGTDPQKFFKVLKGRAHTDPHKAMIVRAEFAVPAGKKYTVSDITIGGVPIDFGSHVAEHLHMRLGARFGPVGKNPEGKATTAPPPAKCVGIP